MNDGDMLMAPAAVTATLIARWWPPNCQLQSAPADRIGRGEGPGRIERNGTVIVIDREEPASRLARLQKPATKACNGDSDEVVGMSWESEWNRLPTSRGTPDQC